MSTKHFTNRTQRQFLSLSCEDIYLQVESFAGLFGSSKNFLTPGSQEPLFAGGSLTLYSPAKHFWTLFLVLYLNN